MHGIKNCAKCTEHGHAYIMPSTKAHKQLQLADVVNKRNILLFLPPTHTLYGAGNFFKSRLYIRLFKE